METPQELLVDHHVLRWLNEQPACSRTAAQWSGYGGLTPDIVSVQLQALCTRGLVLSEPSLAEADYQILPQGVERLREISQPAQMRRARLSFLRDAWIAGLYAGGHVSEARRAMPRSLWSDPTFLIAEPSGADHQETLEFLQARGLTNGIASWHAAFIFIWLTAKGVECVESGLTVAQFLERTTVSGFTQHNTFNNVGVAAAGRDNVSASVQTTIGNASLAELRSLVERLDGEDREEGLTIAADLELATQRQDESGVKQRLRQLARFVGGLADTAAKTLLEAWLKAQMGG